MWSCTGQLIKCDKDYRLENGIKSMLNFQIFVIVLLWSACVCQPPSPNYMLKPQPPMGLCLERGALGSDLGHEDGALMMELMFLF